MGLMENHGSTTGNVRGIRDFDQILLKNTVKLNGEVLTVYLAENDKNKVGSMATIWLAVDSTNYETANHAITIKLTDKKDNTTIPEAKIDFLPNSDGETFTAVIEPVTGAEYSFDGVNWSDNNQKTDCLGGTSYTGYIRMKETEDMNAGQAAYVSKETPVQPSNPGNTGGSGNSGSYGSSSSDDDSSSSGSIGGGQTIADSKRGYVNSVTGIITGTVVGYSRWETAQNANGQGSWKLRYADGTYATGEWKTRADGSKYEQPAWVQVDGKWYAFGADGFTKSGWVYDEALGGWFYLDTNGSMLTGWHLINDKWYFFRMISDGKKGMMFRGGMTPDGYYVDETGAWDGKQR